MGQVLSYFPGQKVTVWLQTLDGYSGLRADPVSLPMVERIILPKLTLACDYPQPMERLDVGLYFARFTLPTGAISIGSYLVDISYPTIDQLDGYVGGITYALYEIVVTAPYGNFGTTAPPGRHHERHEFHREHHRGHHEHHEPHHDRHHGPHEPHLEHHEHEHPQHHREEFFHGEPFHHPHHHHPRHECHHDNPHVLHECHECHKHHGSGQ